MIHRRVTSGRLFPVFRGVYSVGRRPITPIERAAAAVLACGPGAALSHRSAARLWSFVTGWPEPFHVIVATDRRPGGIVAHLFTGLRPSDFTTQLGVRATSPARTLLDTAPQLPPYQLPRLVNDARLGPYLTLDALAEMIARFPRHPGALLLGPLVDAAPAQPTRSSFEDDFLHFCARHGLPTPFVNARICGFEVDAYFPDHRLIVECDGWETHRDRETFERDRDRDATTLAAGLATVRVTRRRMTDVPLKEADRLRAILDGRAGA